MRFDEMPYTERLLKDRRTFLKTLAAGTGALSLGFHGTRSALGAPVPPGRDRSRVSLASGTDRRKIVQEVMDPFKDQIRAGIKGKQVIVKPNMVLTDVPLCAPHVDGLRGVLDFLKPIYNDQVIIAESTASDAGSFDGFKNYGYLPLEKEYGVKFVDLNLEPTLPFMIIDNNIHPLKIQVCGAYLNPNNYIISLTRLKTHNAAIVTLSVKNIAMSAPLRTYPKEGTQQINFKRNMHGRGPHWMNYNLYQIARSIQPQFSVIESVVGLQGNGPHRDGFEMEHGVALAGNDFIAVDSIGCQLMGVASEDIGYLNYCADAGVGIVDRSKIDIVGGLDPQKYMKPYKMHDQLQTMLGWKNELPLQTNEAR